MRILETINPLITTQITPNDTTHITIPKWIESILQIKKKEQQDLSKLTKLFDKESTMMYKRK